jgi:hypothetical protein
VGAEEPIDASALQAVAEAVGSSVTTRQLELWRYRGLLPRPSRQKGARARWLYPPGTDEQLLRLLHWRGQAPSLDLVRIGLWLDGFDIALEGVRASVASFVDGWFSMLDRERPARTDDEGATVDAIAGRFARMRGRAPVPHVVRMSLAERTRAYGYMVAVMFDMSDEVERRRADAVLLERMLGLRSGLGRGLAAVVGLEAVSEQLARLPAPELARRVIDEASDEEYEFVRHLLQVTTVWMPLLLPLLLDEAGVSARQFETLVRDAFSNIPPGFYPFLTCVFLVSLHAKRPGPTELRSHLSTLGSGAFGLELLKELPASARREVFNKLPERTQIAVAGELQRQRRSAAHERS